MTKAFGKRTKMVLGYCSPQVGMAGPPCSSRKREGNGVDLRGIILFSFTTLDNSAQFREEIAGYLEKIYEPFVIFGLYKDFVM